MDAITSPPAPVNEPVRTLRAGQPRAGAPRRSARRPVGEPRRTDDDDRRGAAHGRRRAARRSSPRTSTSSSSARPHRRRPPTSRPPSAPRWRRHRRGASCPSTSAPRCSSAPPTCSRRPGAIGSTRPPCSASRRPCSRPRSTRRASSPTSCASTCTSPARILEQQPISSPGVWNRMEYRPLEGFVLAITPFNFTAIAGNLPSAPAILGNVVVWKPSPTQQLAAHHTMRLFEAAGLPPGVINLVTGDGAAVSEVALRHPALAGIHFTGSTATFQHLWREIGSNIGDVRELPEARRRDGRQGLRDRAPVGRSGGAGDGPGPRRVRVPGPEVLGGIARVRPALAVGRRGCGTSWSPRPSRSPTATSPTSPTSAAR